MIERRAIERSLRLAVTKQEISGAAQRLGIARPFGVLDDTEIGVSAGLTDIEIGLRLRYEIAREFAPYVGVEWAGKVGETARFARAAGDQPSGVSYVAGIRFWF